MSRVRYKKKIFCIQDDSDDEKDNHVVTNINVQKSESSNIIYNICDLLSRLSSINFINCAIIDDTHDNMCDIEGI